MKRMLLCLVAVLNVAIVHAVYVVNDTDYPIKCLFKAGGNPIAFVVVPAQGISETIKLKVDELEVSLWNPKKLLGVSISEAKIALDNAAMVTVVQQKKRFSAGKFVLEASAKPLAFQDVFAKQVKAYSILLGDPQKAAMIPGLSSKQALMSKVKELQAELTDATLRYAKNPKETLYKKLERDYKQDFEPFTGTLKLLDIDPAKAPLKVYEILTKIAGEPVSEKTAPEKLKKVLDIVGERLEEKIVSQQQFYLARQAIGFVTSSVGRESYHAFLKGPDAVEQLRVSEKVHDQLLDLHMELQKMVEAASDVEENGKGA